MGHLCENKTIDQIFRNTLLHPRALSADPIIPRDTTPEPKEPLLPALPCAQNGRGGSQASGLWFQPIIWGQLSWNQTQP